MDNFVAKATHENEGLFVDWVQSKKANLLKRLRINKMHRANTRRLIQKNTPFT